MLMILIIDDNSIQSAYNDDAIKSMREEDIYLIIDTALCEKGIKSSIMLGGSSNRTKQVKQLDA